MVERLLFSGGWINCLAPRCSTNTTCSTTAIPVGGVGGGYSDEDESSRSVAVASAYHIRSGLFDPSSVQHILSCG